MGSVAQSPLGVANAAQPASPAAPVNSNAPAGSGGLLHQGPAGQAQSLNSLTVHHLTLSHSSNLVQAVPITFAMTLPEPGGAASNQATINFLSYLTGSSGTGPDSINYVVANNEGGTNFLYVVGSLTDSTGRTDAFAAKLAGNGNAPVWITSIPATTPGPDSATGVAVNGTNVYVVGSLADPTSTPQTDGFVVELDANSGDMLNQFEASDATFAAVTTDSSGNVYVAGSTVDPNNQNQVDVLVTQISSDLSTPNLNYGGYIPLAPMGVTAPSSSSVTNGGGLVLDSQGNAYFAGKMGVIGDPNSETFATVGRLNADGTTIPWVAYYPNLTPGPGGMGTAVALDPSGNIVVTGSLNDNGSSTMSSDPQGSPTLLNQDMLLDRLTPDGA